VKITNLISIFIIAAGITVIATGCGVDKVKPCEPILVPQQCIVPNVEEPAYMSIVDTAISDAERITRLTYNNEMRKKVIIQQKLAAEVCQKH
jgi:hypothetical protein